MQDLTGENAELRERIDSLQEELEELRRESLAKGQNIENLMQERLEICSRVKRIRKNLSTLEAKESTL
jgi:predicted  nucleic acid-binding Zn-ribbon protein